MLEDLTNPAPKITYPEGWSPSVQFDGHGGEAVLPGVPDGQATDVDAFLVEAGIDPKEVEIVG